MKGYVDDIEQVTTRNTDFRRVVYTGSNLQLVLMTLLPGEEIGEETHDDRDQFFRIEAGEGAILIDGKRHAVRDDFAVIVPAGALHNVVNTGMEPLKLYTLSLLSQRQSSKFNWLTETVCFAGCTESVSSS